MENFWVMTNLYQDVFFSCRHFLGRLSFSFVTGTLCNPVSWTGRSAILFILQRLPTPDVDFQNRYGRKSTSPEVALLHWLVHPQVKILIGVGAPDGRGRALTTEEAHWVSMFSPGLSLLLTLDRVGREEAGPSMELQRLLELSLTPCEVLNHILEYRIPTTANHNPKP